MQMKTCLSIAGFDSSGGAGIQADLKTFAAHGCYGTTVLTALPIQNTCGVRECYAIASAVNLSIGKGHGPLHHFHAYSKLKNTNFLKTNMTIQDFS